MGRHLQFAQPGREIFTQPNEPFLLNSNTVPGQLVLIENDGTTVMIYRSYESFNRIEYRDQMYRMQGRDRNTGEMIYLPEVELI